MNALIVEDSKSTSDLIKERIHKLTNKISLVDQAFTMQATYDLISQRDYDIIFWDINLSMGTSFDILKTLAQQDKINFESIFITGQKESDSIINALKFSAIDYLLKPIDDGLLAEAIEKAIVKRQDTADYNQYKIFMENLMNDQLPSTIAIRLIKGVIVYQETKKITYVEAEGVISKFFIESNNPLYASKNLGYYKPLLSRDPGFFLVSHSAIVNLHQIENYDSKSKVITFRNKMNVTVARRRAKAFEEQMKIIQNKTGILGNIKNIFNK